MTTLPTADEVDRGHVFERRTARGTVTFLPEPKPQEMWCPIISVDDHVLEPATLFSDRVPPSLRDAVPQFLEDDEGVPYWLIDGEQYFYTLGNGSAGRPQSEWGFIPSKFDEFRRSVWDVHARVKDMEANGVWASLRVSLRALGFCRVALCVDARPCSWSRIGAGLQPVAS